MTTPLSTNLITPAVRAVVGPPVSSNGHPLPRRRAVFLDRDGTINEQVGYTNDPAQITLIPGAAESVALLNSLGFLVIMVTNQSAIARGLATVAQVERCCAEVAQQVARASGGHFDGIYYCPYHPKFPDPHHDKFADWRKPRPGMVVAAARDFNIDLPASWMIGDGEIDHSAAKAADPGIRTVVLPSDFHEGDCGADFYAPTLWEAAQIVFGHSALAGLSVERKM
jgi:D-glycero-D-manno-heptose 1,7-bisphosphate phosphatase